jgi:hypothetical protein
MSQAMKRFQDRIYVRTKNHLYVYDSGWESFRPCFGVVWNPVTMSSEPWYGSLTADPLDAEYGYGSSEENDICIALTDALIDKLDSAEEETSLESFWRWSKAPVTWVYDRPLLLAECVEPSWDTWKSYVGSKHRTLRKAPRSFDFRATKRRIR